MDLRIYSFTSWLINCQNLINTCNLCLFSFLMSILSSKALCSISVAHLFVFGCLTSLIACIFNNWQVVLPPIHSTVWICKQITILVLYQFSSTLVNLKLLYSSLQVSNILLIVCFKCINVTSLMFNLFYQKV